MTARTPCLSRPAATPSVTPTDLLEQRIAALAFSAGEADTKELDPREVTR